MKHPYHISLEAVLEEPQHFDFEMPVGLSEIDREPLLEISPVHLAGTVTRIARGHAMDAEVSWQGKLECSRCLAPYPFRSDEAFTLVLAPRRPLPEGEIGLAPEDLDVYFYDDAVVSLLPIAEERIQMGIPMKPLCREDCPGLCPHCGADRNQVACACAEESKDPRWEALRALRR